MIKEGKALLNIELPEVISASMPVFYNPYMVVNRDISMLVVLASLGEEALICDPMGASGVRSVRFILEAKAREVIYNDINPKAVEEFERLLELNGIEKEKVKLFCEDASLLLRRIRNCDYVDIDPFGSPIPFLESGIMPVRRGGILGVSATDTAVLSGTYPETCLRRYHSKPLLLAEFYHEIGVRILIKKVIEEGAKMDYALIPVFAYSYRHHFKVFFKKEIGAKRCNELIRRIGYLLYCPHCLYRSSVTLEEFTNTCPVCGNKTHYAGPLWLGKLWDEDLVNKMWEVRGLIELSEETNKLLKLIKEEAKVQTLGFYTLSAIGERLKVGNLPPLRKVLELTKGVRTHFTGEGFRTPIEHKELLKIVEGLR